MVEASFGCAADREVSDSDRLLRASSADLMVVTGNQALVECIDLREGRVYVLRDASSKTAPGSGPSSLVRSSTRSFEGV
jgi:hypothetical protein